MTKKAILACALACAALSAHAKDRDAPNMLTNGMVNLTVKVGETSQAQLLETFGAPNITTIDGNGQEVWVYDRQATVDSSSSSGFSIGMLLGAGGDGIAGGSGLGFGKRKSRTESSSRTMTLIIKFDARKVVSDFKSRSSSF
ncbi:outer membrane protein assembly factor BamE (lipoprotein component of BamABCDE complex) [Sphingomonas aerophila]|uniref:Outer membrane protein assembly factor BamE (Lipoprotein component of BamABCDE complex) n=2 Tax=Sphingomonas aerophila TaxID=1344948 RepID=A0A7W9BHC2_9SPHN|nr:outer membrane protein assembly factor BamE (lipoprotein component of BamABCDE complex) [Sphingomonas aerophila]